MNTEVMGWVRRGVYFFILCGLVIFLVRKGVEPWLIVLKNWPVLLGVVVISMIGLLVQANAFLTCLPVNTHYPSLKRVIHIWATSGMASLLAPLIASLAVRSLLLQREGISLKASALATIKQTWFNCECALLVAAVVLLLYPWPEISWLGYGLGFIWLGVWAIRRWLPLNQWNWVNKYFPSLPALSESPKWPTFSWLWGQIIVMALNYWIAFVLMGALLTWHESFLLAAITVLASIIIVIPNGLGVLDGLWLWVANQQGLLLDDSVALVLMMRFGYLAAAALIWIGLNPWWKSPPVVE